MLLGTADGIQILKKWRGVANEGEKAVIAVRTGSPMSACEWQHQDDDETYRSAERETILVVQQDLTHPSFSARGRPSEAWRSR